MLCHRLGFGRWLHPSLKGQVMAQQPRRYPERYVRGGTSHESAVTKGLNLRCAAEVRSGEYRGC